jgi:uncharacterized GH25 family protein
MKIRLVCVLSWLLTTASALDAHDFWLAAHPSTESERLTITANLGEHFPHGTDYVAPDGVERWSVVGPAGEIGVRPEFRREGSSLATDVTVPSPGVYLATMVVAARFTVMNGPLFTSYLHEEGLDWVVAARQKNGVSEMPATERYARYAKVAIRTGDGRAPHLQRPFGLPAELVPMTDPTLIRPGQLLTFQFLAHGTPVAGASVAARAESGGHPIMGRTNAMGQVTLFIDRPGGWLVRTVHMVTGAAAGVPGVDWDSYWATFAFTAEAP